MTRALPGLLTPTERRFLGLAAELAESFSFSGTLARIYALLYIRNAPLSLGEIAMLLGMSKGNTSVNLRILESWGAIRHAWVPGTRKDHYEPIRDLKAIALRRLEEGLSRRLAMAADRLEALQAELAQEKDHADESGRRLFRERLNGLGADLSTARKLLRRAADWKSLWGGML